MTTKVSKSEDPMDVWPVVERAIMTHTFTKGPRIQDVAVDCSGEQYALHCFCDGARYHVWLNRHTRAIQDTLYKNPPLGVPYRGEGWFATRHLETGSKFGKALILSMLEQATAANLFEKAEERVRMRAEAEQEERNEHARQERIKAAAPCLLEALEQCLYYIPGYALNGTEHDTAGRPWLIAALDAIKKARGM